LSSVFPFYLLTPEYFFYHREHPFDRLRAGSAHRGEIKKSLNADYADFMVSLWFIVLIII
jgi:hypothetical protein